MSPRERGLPGRRVLWASGCLPSPRRSPTTKPNAASGAPSAPCATSPPKGRPGVEFPAGAATACAAARPAPGRAGGGGPRGRRGPLLPILGDADVPFAEQDLAYALAVVPIGVLVLGLLALAASLSTPQVLLAGAAAGLLGAAAVYLAGRPEAPAGA